LGIRVNANANLSTLRTVQLTIAVEVKDQHDRHHSTLACSSNTASSPQYLHNLDDPLVNGQIFIVNTTLCVLEIQTDQHLPRALLQEQHLFNVNKLSNTFLMTMVYEQSRQFGGLAYEPMYPHQHQQTQWKDPFHNSNAAYPPMKQETSRPMNLSMPYSQMPTSAPLISGSNYSTAGFVESVELSIPQDISRSTYPSQQQYSSASGQSSSYATAGAYQSMDYAHSLQQQQAQQQQRKLSDQ
jgi:hypothetical protein